MCGWEVGVAVGGGAREGRQEVWMFALWWCGKEEAWLVERIRPMRTAGGGLGLEIELNLRG